VARPCYAPQQGSFSESPNPHSILFGFVFKKHKIQYSYIVSIQAPEGAKGAVALEYVKVKFPFIQEIAAMPTSEPFTYTGAATRQISFPLGGIGTGCIGLAGDGRLIDWEIANRPNKGSLNGFSHFAIKAEASDGRLLDARVLHGDLQPGSHVTLTGKYTNSPYTSYGFGVPRELLAGLPHFQAVEFTGQFPVANLRFIDSAFPGHIRLTAFNPLIPLNEDDSGLPAAFFEFQVNNPTQETIKYTLCGTLGNPLPENNVHTLHHSTGATWLHLASDGLKPEETAYGELCLGSDALHADAQLYWYRGRWFDELETFWQDFTQPRAHSSGALVERSYLPEQAGNRNNASLAVPFELAPGARRLVRFVIAWYFPNFENYWNMGYRESSLSRGIATVWKNYYATRFSNAGEVLRYCLVHWQHLFGKTMAFKDALFSSSLPLAVLDAVSANLSVLKSPTVARLEDGTFYGFEGCHPDAGCCEGSCTHVWNYAQALPFLFPRLERSMRQADFAYNQRDDGGMRFRIPLPVVGAAEFYPFRACADGQFGGVLKAYRDWKICGDLDWLRSIWSGVKKSIEFAWAGSNPDQWDPEQSGVLRGRMHHTMDMELFGPDPWLTGFYLGALKAGAEMAEAVGEKETARSYQAIFEKGKSWVEENLFNGEYFYHQVNLKDRTLVSDPRYQESPTSMVGADERVYWDEEHEEIKYQVAEGCLSDQLLAQWHAGLYGLGELFNPTQARQALQSIYRYNFKHSLRDHFNPHRIYSLDDEGGLLICTYPPGRQRPAFPVPYAHETWTGVEYSTASLMIQSGLEEEGLSIVKAVRLRHDGEKRNPWNEFECGSNYARSMASYALLNAYSGFQFDMAQGMIGFAPVENQPRPFRCFWSLEPAWGAVAIGAGWAELQVMSGALPLKAFRLPGIHPKMHVQANLAGMSIPVRVGKGEMHFDADIAIQTGQALILRWEG
jgi:non-lysosomal glucosylceramidase